MSDRYDIEYAFHRFLDAIPAPAWNDLMKAAEDRVWSEVGDLSTDCEEEHCSDHELPHGVHPALPRVSDKIARLRLGVYDESRDGTLLETLEEIERILGNG